MWYSLGKWILKFRVSLLIILLIATAVMGYFASKVELSYEFGKAIPTDNPKYQDYLAFKQKFGDDGNLLVIGVQSGQFYDLKNFRALAQLHNDLKSVKGVENVLSIPEAITLIKNDTTSSLVSTRIFPAQITNQQQLDSGKAVFENLPFYKGNKKQDHNV